MADDFTLSQIAQVAQYGQRVAAIREERAVRPEADLPLAPGRVSKVYDGAHQSIGRTRGRAVAALRGIQQKLDLVGRLEDHVRQPGRYRDRAIARAVEEAFDIMRESGHRIEAAHSARPFNRVESAKQPVHGFPRIGFRREHQR